MVNFALMQACQRRLAEGLLTKLWEVSVSSQHESVTPRVPTLTYRFPADGPFKTAQFAHVECKPD